jgi:hypothetical protein
MEQLSHMSAIRKFFEEGTSGRKVEITELKALSLEERRELGDMCLKALGAELATK